MAIGGSPRERPDAPRPRWPAGFAGMLALMIAAEFGLIRAGREIEPLITADWRRDRQAASSEEARRAEVLCFGDSLVKTGVAPAALEARLDRPAYNLAALNLPTPATYAVFRRALAAGARPRAIVLDANEAQLWASHPRDLVATWAGLIGPSEAFQLARDEGDPGFLGLYLVHYLLPSVRIRLDLRTAIHDLIARRPPGTSAPWPLILKRQYERNRGGIVLPELTKEGDPDPFPGGVLPPDEGVLWYRSGPTARPTNLVYLDRLLRLARSRGITVFFVVPPIHPGVLEVREGRGLEAQYLGLVRRVCDRYENVVVIDGRHAGFDYPLFHDSCHMHMRGATAFSQTLAEAMAPWLDGTAGGDRWVSLPPFAEPTARLPIETLHESQFIVSWLLAHH